MSKASSGGSRRKSSPSKSSLNKQLDQMKQQQQQRKKGSPVSSPGSGLTRSLSSSGISSKKSVMVGDVSVGEGRGTAEDDKSMSQVAALLGYSGSPVGSVSSSDGSEQLLSLVVGADRIQSPRPSLPAGIHEKGVVSPGTLSAGGVVFPTGGMIVPVSGISPEQGGVVSESLLPGMKIKQEPVSPTPPVMLLPAPVSSKPPTPQLSFTKPPLDVRTIKREPSSASPTMEASSSRVLATPSKDDKMHMPMQTPPSTHVVQMPAEVHVIIQQPNAAALPVQETSTSPMSKSQSPVLPGASVPTPTLSSSNSSAVAASPNPTPGHSVPVTSALATILSSSTKAAASSSSLKVLSTSVSAGQKSDASTSMGVSSGASLLPTSVLGVSLVVSGGGVTTSSASVVLSSSLSAGHIVGSSTSPVLSTGPNSAIVTGKGSTSLLTSSYPVLSSVVGGGKSVGGVTVSSVHSVISPVTGPVISPVTGPVISPVTRPVISTVTRPEPVISPVTGPGPVISTVTGPGISPVTGPVIGSLLASSSPNKATPTLSLSLSSSSAKTSGSTGLAGPNVSSMGSGALISSSHSVTLSPIISAAISGGGARVSSLGTVEGLALADASTTSSINIVPTARWPGTSGAVASSATGVSLSVGSSPVTATAAISKVPPISAPRSSSNPLVATGVLRQTALSVVGGVVKTLMPATSKELKALSVGMATVTGAQSPRPPDQLKPLVTPSTVQAPPRVQSATVRTSPVTFKSSPVIKTPPTTSANQVKTQTLTPITTTFVSPQSAKQAMPSSTSLTVAGTSLDAPKLLVPVKHIATKSPVLPTLSLSSLVSTHKSVPTSLLPQGTPPQAAQKVGVVYLEKKVVASKQRQEVALAVKSALPAVSTVAAASSNKSVRVASSTAVATSPTTTSQPKQSAAPPSSASLTPPASSPSSSSAPSRSPVTTIVSSSSSSAPSRSPVTTIVSSSLTIPILSPSKDLLTAVKQTVSLTARASGGVSASGPVSEPASVMAKRTPTESKGSRAHLEQKKSGAKAAEVSLTPPSVGNKVSESQAGAKADDTSAKILPTEPDGNVFSGISDVGSNQGLESDNGDANKGERESESVCVCV